MKYELKIIVYYLDLNNNERRTTQTFVHEKPYYAMTQASRFVATLEAKGYKVKTRVNIGRWICGK